MKSPKSLNSITMPLILTSRGDPHTNVPERQARSDALYSINCGHNNCCCCTKTAYCGSIIMQCKSLTIHTVCIYRIWYLETVNHRMHHKQRAMFTAKSDIILFRAALIESPVRTHLWVFHDHRLNLTREKQASGGGANETSIEEQVSFTLILIWCLAQLIITTR